MPELPEVETVRAGLVRSALGRRVADVAVLHPRAVRHHRGDRTLPDGLRGATLRAAARRGKYLWLELGATGAREALLLHLGMSGQVLLRSDAAPRDVESGTPEAFRTPVLAHLRVRLTFADGGELWFVDQRTFGHVLVAPLVPTTDGGPGGTGSASPLLPEPITHIARDLLDPLLAPGTPGRRALVERLRARRTGIKRALLDQTLVSGIGNIYADEGLWRAGEHHGAPTWTMSRPRVGRILDAVQAVMTEALAAGGTSFDALYVNVNGSSGSFDRSLAVYGRAGAPCRRCGAVVVREPFMNRSSFRCPSCQRAPRPAAGRHPAPRLQSPRADRHA